MLNTQRESLARVRLKPAVIQGMFGLVAAAVGGFCTLMGAAYLAHNTFAWWDVPPSPGTILYRADWSNGLDGWSADNRAWLANHDGILTVDTTSQSGWFGAWPPYRPRTKNYEVSTEVSMIKGQSFGVEVRADRYSGYNASVDWQGPNRGTAYIYADQADGSQLLLAQQAFHTYRTAPEYDVMVEDNHIRLMVNGVEVVSAFDNQYAGPGAVYLWVGRSRVDVRSFDITAL